MKKRVKQIVSLILAGAMTVSLAACGSGGSSTSADASADAVTDAVEATDATDSDDATPVVGGTATLRYSEFYGEYDPASCNNRCYVSMYCDTLWDIDWDTDRDEFNYVGNYLDAEHLVGNIAKSWEVAEDFSSITITLRDDVYFQDKVAAGFDEEYDIYKGRQLTATDVEFSYARLLGINGYEKQELDQTSWAADLSMIDSIEVVDDQTIVFNFNTDTQLAVDQFMCVRVNIAGPEWDELSHDQKVDWHYASGTGPFILTDYVTDNTMTFEKNPNYFGTDSDGVQLPYLDEVKLVYFAEKETAMAAFIAGEIDAVNTSGTFFDADQTAQIAQALGDGYYTNTFYAAPMSIGLKQGTNPVEALTNEKVREALQYAIDLEAISEYMGYGYTDDDPVTSKVAGVFASTTAWGDVESWSDELLASYTTYDPEKAKELLTEAGYPDGFEFTCQIFAMLPTDLFQLIAEQLAEVGVTMNVEIGNTPQDMTSVGMDASDPTCVFFTGSSDSTNAAYMNFSDEGQTNYVKQNDSELTTLFDAFYTATTTEDQVAAAKEFDQAYMAQHYMLLITYSERYQSFYRSNFHGMKGGTPMANYYYGTMLARCWVDAE